MPNPNQPESQMEKSKYQRLKSAAFEAAAAEKIRWTEFLCGFFMIQMLFVK